MQKNESDVKYTPEQIARYNARHTHKDIAFLEAMIKYLERENEILIQRLTEETPKGRCTCNLCREFLGKNSE